MYIVARNSQGRPMLMHKLDIPNSATERTLSRTACGVELKTRSRSIMPQAIPAILCKRCAIIAGATS